MIPGLKKRALNLHDVYLYVAMARKHFRLTTLILVLSALCGLAYFIYARPVYYSKALIRMDYVPLPMDTDKLFHDQRLRVMIKELQAPHIIERTALRLGLKGNSREIQRDFILKSTVRLNSEKNLEIEVWPASPELGRRWAPTLVQEFEAYRKEKHFRDSQNIVNAYSREIREVSSKLGESLDKKFQIRDAQDVTRAMIDLQKYNSVPVEIVLMERRLDDMGRVRIRLTDPSLDVIAKLSLLSSLDQDPQLAMTSQLDLGDEVKVNDTPRNENAGHPADANATPAPGNGSNVRIIIPSMVPTPQAWQNLQKERQEILNQVTEASATYRPGHRIMREMNAQLESIDQKLAVEYQVTKNRFDLEYQELINKKAELTEKLEIYAAVTKRGQEIKQNATIFNMSRLPWERMASEMKRKIEALQFAWEKERIDLKFIDILDIRNVPVSPNRGKLVLIALFVGTILGLGVPFLIEYLDHTMSNLEQVESTFRLRGLGIVPKLENGRPDALIDHDDRKESSLLENFRVIRTNLLSMGTLSKPPHVLMVTSAMPREGKTVVSSNLAISFAQGGSRTLLIDTDLRRGRMHRLFGYRKNPGLSGVLLDEISIDEACRPTNHENLFILSAGKHLDSGTELLASEKFDSLIATLRQRFDRIVIDTPPVLGLSETSILQKHVDGVLFVIWSAHTPIRNIQAAIDGLQANGANFYGFVLNRLDLSATENYYQYYYYSQDYYYNYSPRELERV